MSGSLAFVRTARHGVEVRNIMRPTIGIDRLTSSRRIDHRAKSADDGSGGTFASDFETQPRRLVRL